MIQAFEANRRGRGVADASGPGRIRYTVGCDIGGTFTDLVLHGSDDPIVPVVNARILASRIRDAALHVHYGATGPQALLEGPHGLFAAFTDVPGALRNAGDGWLIGEVSFKPFAACRHAHPAIDAAMVLRGEGRLQAPFHVETYADALAFCDRPSPETELEAKFSLQHAVALVADGRKAEPEDFTPEAIAALADLRAQVEVREDPAITARYPAHFGARVNGFELTDCLGDPERPVSEEQLVGKLHTLARWGGPAALDRLTRRPRALFTCINAI